MQDIIFLDYCPAKMSFVQTLFGRHGQCPAVKYFQLITEA